MAIPAWFWPPSGAAARGVSLVPYGSGLAAVPDWRTPTVWLFSVPSSRFLGGLVLPSGGVYATGTPGLAMASPDTTSGMWTVRYDGSWWHMNASGALFVPGGVSGNIPFGSSGALLSSGVLPSGQVYVGCATPNGSAFFLAATGTVLTSGGTVRGTWPSAPALGFASSGTTLATLLPSSGVVGLMVANTGVSGQIALPAAITTPSCVTMSSGSLAIAGWQTAPALPSGAAAAALNPQDADTMAAVGSGYALIFRASPSTAVSGENWSQASVLTGLANAAKMAWRPDGTQVLASSNASGIVQVLGYSAGLLSLAQNLSVVGAGPLMVAGTSSDALVVQAGVSQLAVLTFATGAWSLSTHVTGFPGINSVAAFGPSGAVATWTSGITFINLTSAGWVTGPSAATSFAPTFLAVDQFLQVYVASSGVLNVFSGTVLTGSGTLPGLFSGGIAVQDGRVVLATPQTLYVYGESAPGAWTQQYSALLPSTFNASLKLGQSLTTLFVMTTGAVGTLLYGFSGTPYVLTQVTSGAAAQWNGSSWTTTALGIGHNPSCCTFDASGNLQVATVQNTLWSITSGGVGTSGIIAQYSGQDQTVPMGPSAVLASSGGLYVATSMAGVLVRAA